MNAQKHREEHANTLLAQILRGLSIDAQAETKGNPNRKMPDIVIKSGGKKIIIEAEYNNTAGAEKDADARLYDGSKPGIIGAISYPPAFEEDFQKAFLSHEPLDFAFKAASKRAGNWEDRWRTGTVYDLAQALRRPNALTKLPHNEIAIAVADIDRALGQFAEQFHNRPGDCENMAKLLQASLPVAGDKRNDDERKKIASKSVPLAGLILTGAFMFQAALASRGVSGIQSPGIYEGKGYNISHIKDAWEEILNINYVAIFKIALGLIMHGNIQKDDMLVLLRVALDVQRVASEGTDVMGGVYHELLAELAKPLGAYYTTIPAATMLSALALPLNDSIEWDNPEKISELRIADLACGSGTLLAAVCGQVRDNAMRRHVEKIIAKKNMPMGNGGLVQQTHAALMENVIWGFDVLDAAAHLTATTLGLMSPEVDFTKSHIYRAAIGINDFGSGVAGSFNLFNSNQVTRRLFEPKKGAEAQIEHAETGEALSEPLPKLDLCLMNPPFVVGRKGAISYSFLPEKDAEAVRQTIRAISLRNDFHMAGMGPGFIHLAEKYVKQGGRIAMIMSATLASGRNKAWTAARNRIEKSCDLEHLIVSREVGRFNFSSSTNLQECMFIARKRLDGEKKKEHAMFSVLTENPQDANAAYATAKAITEAANSKEGFGDLKIRDRQIGEFAFLRYRNRNMPWGGTAFTNLRLTMAANLFAEKGKIMPYSSNKSALPVCPLATLADFGSYRLHRYTNVAAIEEKVRPRLGISKTKTKYASYYPGYHKLKTGIGQKDITSILESPTCYFMPLTNDDKSWADKYFSWGGKIAINVSFGFSSSRRLVTLLSEPVQGANYQPVRLKEETPERSKAMVLWLNSTLSTMMIAMYSVNCGGSKVMFSKEAAENLPALNLDALSSAQITALAEEFDIIAEMQFGKIPEMAEDPARIAIDDALVKTLDLRDFDFNGLRHALADEPIINGKSTAAK